MWQAMGGFRRQATFGVAILLLASIAAALVLTGATAAPRSPEDPMERLVLRLPDLPPGYVPFGPEGSDFELICEPLDPADSQPRLASFIRRFSPEGCMGLYLRAYRLPGTGGSAAVVGTGALDAGSVEAAEAGFAVAPEMLATDLAENETPKEVAAGASVGDATALFHWKRVPRFFRNSHLGSYLVWRSGDVLGAVFASAGSLATSDRIVVELAQRQQAHIEDPTPYTRAERNTSEIGLDDPALKLPVYWLGRNFKPGHGLPATHLESGGRAHYHGVGLLGAKVELQYDKGLSLSSWTRTGWRRFLAAPDGRAIFAERCLTSTDVAVAGGRATIYTGHVAGFRPCAAGSPRRFFAVVHQGSIVVGIRLSSCRDCLEPARGSYLRPAPQY